MPIFKVRPEQPALPARSSSVPPMHLHSPGADHALAPATCLGSVREQLGTPTRAGRPDTFAWARLPRHLQHRVLSYALVPDGPDTPVIIGLPGHRVHLGSTAVPVFLALGSWEAYSDAASVLYRRVHVDLTLHKASSMAFLTSPAAARPRSLVVGLQLRFTVREHLLLFDTGHTVSRSRGKLIQVNIPTALRSMRTHGRLCGVELLIPAGLPAAGNPQDGGGAAAVMPGFYSPMARIQLAGWAPVPPGHHKPAELIVAPAFLASRAFQSGLLPLLEEGVFDKRTRLGLLPAAGDAEEDVAGDGNSTAAVHVDVDTLVRYWLGATVVQLFEITHVGSTWVDPFSLTVQPAEGSDEMTLAETEALPAGREIIPSREAGYDLVSSPIKYLSSDQGSDADSLTEEVMVDSDALRGESQPEEPASQGRLKLSSSSLSSPSSSDDDTSSEDSSSSEEAVRELHKTFGVTPPKKRDARSEPRDNSPSPLPDEDEDESSSTSGDPDAVSPSPAMHLRAARTDLITTLAAAISSGDTMDAIARATADRQPGSSPARGGGGPGRPCGRRGTAVPAAVSPPAAAADTPSGTLAPGDNAASSGADTDTSPPDGREHGLPWADLSLVEDVFGARAEHATVPDAHGGLNLTNCDLSGVVSGPAKAEEPSYGRREAGREGSVDLGTDEDGETFAAGPAAGKGKGKGKASPAGTKPGATANHQGTTPATPAHHPPAESALTPLSAGSKRSVKTKGTQTRRRPEGPSRVTHSSLAPGNSRASERRKAPAAAPDRPSRPSRAQQRKRARAAKEAQLRVTRRIEAEAAEREKTIVN